MTELKKAIVGEKVHQEKITLSQAFGAMTKQDLKELEGSVNFTEREVYTILPEGHKMVSRLRLLLTRAAEVKASRADEFRLRLQTRETAIDALLHASDQERVQLVQSINQYLKLNLPEDLTLNEVTALARYINEPLSRQTPTAEERWNAVSLGEGLSSWQWSRALLEFSSPLPDDFIGDPGVPPLRILISPELNYKIWKRLQRALSIVGGPGTAERLRAHLIERLEIAKLGESRFKNVQQLLKRLSGDPLFSIEKLTSPGDFFTLSYIVSKGCQNDLL